MGASPPTEADRTMLLPLLLSAALVSGEDLRPVKAMELSFDHSHVVVHEQQESLWVRGRTYKAKVSEEGFTYVPFLGSAAPRNWPVQFTVTGASLGGEAVRLEAPRYGREQQGVVLTLDRGPLKERYVAGTDGVEQWILVEVPRRAVEGADGGARGDLVVTIELGTDLDVRASMDGHAFEGPSGGVVVGAASVLVHGQSHGIETRALDGVLEIRVPDSLVKASGDLVVIDPLITTASLDDISLDLGRPTVAYEASTNSYLVAYEEDFSVQDTDVYSRQFEAGTLAVVDGAYLGAFERDVHSPSAASLASTNTFMVACSSEDEFGRPLISAFTRNADPQSTFAPERVLVQYLEFYETFRFDLGGEAYEGTGTSTFALTWTRALIGDVSSEVMFGRFDELGAAVGPQFSLSGPPAIGSNRPAISKFSGDPLQHGAWNVVWRTISNGARGVGQARVNFAGTVSGTTNNLLPPCNLGAVMQPAVSAPYAGVGGEVQLSIAKDCEAPFAFRCTANTEALLPTSALSPAPLAEVDVSEGTFNRSTYAVITGRGVASVVYTDSPVGDDGSTRAIFMTTVSTTGALRSAVVERRIRLTDAAAVHPYTIDAASSFSGGALDGRALIAWDDYYGGTADRSIRGALVVVPEIPAIGVADCGFNVNSTGDYGFLTAYGTGTTSDAMVLQASALPPNTVGYLLASRTTGSAVPFSSQGELCLGGSIGRYSNQVLDTGSAGTAGLIIDPAAISQPTGSVAALTGERWYFQFWYRDANPSVVSNLTNSTSIQF